MMDRPKTAPVNSSSTPRMSYWGRSDPVIVARQLGCVHWLNVRNEVNRIRTGQLLFNTAIPEYIVGSIPQSPGPHYPSEGYLPPLQQSQPPPEPKTSIEYESRRPNFNRLRTSYNEQARLGVKYWYQTRPKSTLFGRYAMGAKHTQLGLGNAPRT